jgi:glycine/D-amino acid oxidase-like deaminating enzyme
MSAALPVVWPPSLWASVSPPPMALPILDSAETADVVIIGAGFTGLSSAIHLREAGLDVVLVEAAEPGWGASGRNNGQVIPTLSGHDPSGVIKRYGEAGERFNLLVRDSAGYLFDLVRRYAIAAEAEQSGWVQPAHSPGRLKRSEARTREWQALGAPVDLLDASAMADMLGSNAWFGGMVNSSGGHINPLALARGLAQVAAGLGVRIYARSPVTSHARQGLGWTIATASGSVKATALVLATNAYTGEFTHGLMPAIATEVIPVRSWQMSTTPISDNVRKSIIPARQAMSDTHRELYFARWDARGRLITGGAAIAPGAGGVHVAKHAIERLKRLWPQLGDIEIDHVWNGYVGMTPENLLRPEIPGFPRFHRLGPSGYAWAGCNGRGVALSVILGRDISRAIQGVPENELGLPFSEPSPRILQPLIRRIAPLALPYYRYLDRQEV